MTTGIFSRGSSHNDTLNHILASHQKQLEDIYDKIENIHNDINDNSSACQLKDMELASNVKNNMEILTDLKTQVISLNNKILSIELDLGRLKSLDSEVEKRNDLNDHFWRNIMGSLLVVLITAIAVNPIISTHFPPRQSTITK